ncbi:MAG: NAD-dependent deacylase, partial [Thermoanaerobaculia bacterium]|nr:NAD-dependent deacylase [Thermoanaerobaculia bacterium]
PGVVWFGEPIDAEVLRDSASALDCDVCLVVGTSSVVYPAAGLSGEARRRGAFVAVLNPDADAGAEDADLVLAGRAEEVLDELEAALTREWR